MVRRCLAVPLATVAAMLLTVSGVGAGETREEWQARVEGLKQKYEAKKQAVATAVENCNLAQRKLNSVRVNIDPFKDPDRYQQEYDTAKDELDRANDAWRDAVKERDDAFREYERVLKSPPRQPGRP